MRRLVVLSLLLFPFAAHSSNEPTAEALLLEPSRLSRWLEENHPGARAAREQVNAAAAERDASALRPNPELEVGASNLAVGRRNRTDVGLAAAFQVGLSQSLDLTTRGPRKAAAARLHDAEAMLALREHETLIHEAREALAEVAWRGLRQEVLAENLRLAEEAAALMAERVAHGDASGADHERLRLEATRLRAEWERSQAKLDAAKKSCEAVVLVPCELPPDDSLLLSSARLPDGESSPDDRSDLRALRLQAEAERQQERLASRRAIPDPQLRLFYEHDPHRLSNDDPYTVGVGVAFALPLFDRGTKDAAASSARARSLLDRQAAESARARADAAALRQRLDSLLASDELLSTRALPSSQAVVHAAEISFEQGETSVTELLLARRDHLELRLRLLELRFELFEVRNDLRYVLGLDASEREKI